MGQSGLRYSSEAGPTVVLLSKRVMWWTILQPA